MISAAFLEPSRLLPMAFHSQAPTQGMYSGQSSLFKSRLSALPNNYYRARARTTFRTIIGLDRLRTYLEPSKISFLHQSPHTLSGGLLIDHEIIISPIFCHNLLSELKYAECGIVKFFRSPNVIEIGGSAMKASAWKIKNKVKKVHNI